MAKALIEKLEKLDSSPLTGRKRRWVPLEDVLAIARQHEAEQPQEQTRELAYAVGFEEGAKFERRRRGKGHLEDLIQRLKAVPVRVFLRIPTGHPLLSAELMIGELCHEAAAALGRQTVRGSVSLEMAAKRLWQDFKENGFHGATPWDVLPPDVKEKQRRLARLCAEAWGIPTNEIEGHGGGK